MTSTSTSLSFKISLTILYLIYVFNFKQLQRSQLPTLKKHLMKALTLVESLLSRFMSRRLIHKPNYCYYYVLISTFPTTAGLLKRILVLANLSKNSCWTQNR